MGRLTAALFLVLVLAACGKADDGAEERLPDLSGLAWLGGDRFLAVHDAKNPAEDDRIRASVLRLPQSPDGIDAEPVDLDWPQPQGESSDLESADRVPGTNRVLFAESGDDGGPYHRIFVAEHRGDTVELVGFAQWPTDVQNVEGIAVARVGGRLVFVYAERAQGQTRTTLAWADIQLDPLRFGDFRHADYSSPEPTGPNGRPVSALTVDSAGRLYVASAFDPGSDDGPYTSFVWRAGRFRAADDGPELVLQRSPTLLGTFDGFKVESVAVSERDGRITVLAGTDDENYGGTLRPLPAG